MLSEHRIGSRTVDVTIPPQELLPRKVRSIAQQINLCTSEAWNSEARARECAKQALSITCDGMKKRIEGQGVHWSLAHWEASWHPDPLVASSTPGRAVLQRARLSCFGGILAKLSSTMHARKAMSALSCHPNPHPPQSDSRCFAAPPALGLEVTLR